MRRSFVADVFCLSRFVRGDGVLPACAARLPLRRHVLWRALAAGVVGATLAGCHAHVAAPAPQARPMPPAHAPAHGLRKKHHDHELRFDSGLGVYVLVDLPDLYFWDDVYWRFRDGVWLHARLSSGPWIVVHDHPRIPPGLTRKHAPAKSQSNDRPHDMGKGKDKAKGKDKKDEKGKGKSDRD